MTDAEVKEFWRLARANMLDRGQRTGQAYMNALREVAPVLYDDITTTPRDIFYRDTSEDIYRFRDYLGI